MNTWQELRQTYESLPEPRPVWYRLYYDEHGHPVVYSMEDLPGNYIEIDRETYVIGSHNVKVINSKLIHLTLRTSEKLKPSQTGTPCHKEDVAVVDPQGSSYWSKHFYGENS